MNVCDLRRRFDSDHVYPEIWSLRSLFHEAHDRRVRKTEYARLTGKEQRYIKARFLKKVPNSTFPTASTCMLTVL